MRNIYGGESELNPSSISSCKDAYKTLERFLEKGDFVVGNEMTVADISIDTSLITLDMIIPVDKNEFPKTFAWMERMKSLLPDYDSVNVEGAKALQTRITMMMAKHKAEAK